MLLQAKIDGEVMGIDPDSVTSREYKEIKSYTGLGMVSFWRSTEQLGGEDMAVEVLDVLRWLMKKRAGSATFLTAEPDDYSPAEFIVSIMEMNKDAIEAAAAEAEDPKVSDPTTEELPKS
jgi:hypothetical protein